MGKRKRKNRGLSLDEPEFDKNFYFIAGYTEGGVPFGVTWHELIEFLYQELEVERDSL